MYIDTHCHISKEYYENIELVIKENENAGIGKMIISGCDKSSILESIDIASSYPNVFLSLGYHPSESGSVGSKELSLLENVIVNTPKIVAIGEIGLDYHYGKEQINKQKDIFRKQLEMAKRLNLPVVIHSRDATEDTINILKEYEVRGVIHCFTGSLETAIIYIKMGYKLGIGGVITFSNSKLKEVVEKISLNDIVVETDAPYLAPVPYRGKQNSSKYIPNIIEYIAEIKGFTLEETQKQIYTSTLEMFDFNK